MSPLIVSRTSRTNQSSGTIRTDVAHIVDIVPTILAYADGQPSTESDTTGIDLLSQQRDSSQPLFYEHEKSRAVRKGDWKLVNRGKSTEWELYNLRDDRTEQDNLASTHPDLLKEMAQLWKEWARQHHVRTR